MNAGLLPNYSTVAALFRPADYGGRRNTGGSERGIMNRERFTRELLGKSKNELRDLCQSLGEPAYRGGQIYHALYAERKFDVQQMTNLPAAFRQRLAAEAQITLPTVRQRYVSQDGSMRYLFALHEVENEENADAACEEAKGTAKNRRPAAVEAVVMPRDGRQTICISTQAGCAGECQTCLNTAVGLNRHLNSREV